MIFGKRYPSAARAHETVEEMGRIIDALAGSRRPAGVSAVDVERFSIVPVEA